jgi:hypothetical protein
MEQSIPFQVPSKMTAARFRTSGSENQIYPGDSKRAIIFLDIGGILNRTHKKAHSRNRVVATDLLARLKIPVLSADDYWRALLIQAYECLKCSLDGHRS